MRKRRVEHRLANRARCHTARQRFLAGGMVQGVVGAMHGGGGSLCSGCDTVP